MSKSDKIKELFLEGKSINEIAEELSTQKGYVKRTVAKLEKIAIPVEPVEEPVEEEPEVDEYQDFLKHVEQVRQQALDSNLHLSVRYLNNLDLQLNNKAAHGFFAESLHYTVQIMFQTLRPVPTHNNMWSYLWELNEHYKKIYPKYCK